MLHIGGTATRITEQSEMIAKRPGLIKIYANLDYADTIDVSGTTVRRCIVCHPKLFILDADGTENASFNVPYGSTIFVNKYDKVAAGTILIHWDPYTDIMLARETGLVSLNDFIEV